MFFDSFNSEQKRLYNELNPTLKQLVFPGGKSEFLCIGELLRFNFVGRDIRTLFRIYAAIYSYYGMKRGNAYRTYEYTKGRALGVLSEEEALTILAIAATFAVMRNADNSERTEKIAWFRSQLKYQIDVVNFIKAYPEVFSTKEYQVGSINNPILVDGVEGVEIYLGCLDFDAYLFGIFKTKTERTSTMQLTDHQTGLVYSIDEYTVKIESSEMVLAKLWFNIYGTQNCPICPSSYKFKQGSVMEQAKADYDRVKEQEAINLAISQNKKIYTKEAMVDFVLNYCKNIAKDIIQRCNQRSISYDYIKLFAASCSYFYQIWMLCFDNLTLGQEIEIRDIYVKKVVQNYISLHGACGSGIMANEAAYKAYLDYVKFEIRDENNKILNDCDVLDRFVLELVVDSNQKDEIKDLISKDIIHECRMRAKEFFGSVYIVYK